MSLFATNVLVAQSQDPPSEEDLKRKMVKRTYTDVSDAKNWEVKVEYPELRLKGDLPHEGFRLAAKNIVMNQVKEFKKNAEDYDNEDRKDLPKFYMEMGYTIETDSENIVSVYFGKNEYLGGAHPNNYSYTLNYDLKNNRQLKLPDLFKENSNYLKIISENSIAQIAEKQGNNSDNDWIKRGAGEDLKNFESWVVTREGFRFTFDAYQVGSYAEGPYETVVPYEKFSYKIQKPIFYQLARVSYVDGSPPNICRNGLFTRQTADFKLAYVKGKRNQRTHFYGDENDCPNSVNCKKKSYLITGDEVIIGRTYNGFACAWYQPKKGSETVGWLPIKNLTIQGKKSPRYSWIGNWKFGENDIRFIPMKNNRKLKVKGNAFWRGLGDNIHIGELDHSGTPRNGMMSLGNKAEKYDCYVKMQRLGKYLLVADNKKCGGVNVTFDGIYVKK